MRSRLIFPFIVAVTTASVVQNLTAATFPAFVASNELALIAFVAPWCQFCHELYPQYEAAGNTLQANEYGSPLARIDCEIDGELCRQYKIPIYPTIRLFQDHGKKHSIYNGKRRADIMVAFMKRRSHPVITRLATAQEATEFSKKDRVTIVGYFDNSDASSGEAFKALAESYRDDYLFGFTTDEAFGNAENIQKPSIIIYKSFDERRNVYQGAIGSESARDFVLQASTPRIREIGVDLHYASSTHTPLAVIFAKGQKQREELVSALWPVAESTPDILWTVVDPEDFPDYAPRVGLPPGEWPAFGIEHLQINFSYAFPIRGSVAALGQAAIRKVLDDFSNKRLVGSEELPKELVGEEVVDKSAALVDYNSGQDPLLELERLSGGAWKAKRDEL